MAGWVGHLHHVSDTPGEAQGPGDRDRDADTTLSCLLRTRRGMTSFVTRKRSRWKSEMMSRKTEEVFWDKYVAKLWKSYGEGKVIKRSHFPHVTTLFCYSDPLPDTVTFLSLSGIGCNVQRPSRNQIPGWLT